MSLMNASENLKESIKNLPSNKQKNPATTLNDPQPPSLQMETNILIRK